ncbi:pyruvate dehydrogenase phosphatase regulatory subunit, mitochondrial-like [Saccostrea echinata]|uniref:pyruvate dehydrogenase phosphatase regulatory subunit, mitochondrial-like n=1 Tax=Saccostrea echinata TaxID=191078 RepID=UPI002A82BF78|nr:pyruvate dehydrogenase phosphatase regulatory subunit, mitochondrial-like [Saccostrea echinata]XP_061163485.1 pyruvate dehydrogenase phosphatase regulatory subunit, mitochondrial-like [Saccostrea echinata]
MSVLQCVRTLSLGRRTLLSQGICTYGGQNRFQTVLGGKDRRCYSETTLDPPPALPSSARVVICGGGVIGTSVAYHLAKAGWTDVVLLEQGQLTGGTTWHSAGLISQARQDVSTSKLMRYGRKLYQELEAEGHNLSFKQCGSLMLAQSKDRLIYLQRRSQIAIAAGNESHIITPQEAKKICPLIRIDDLEGALWIPEDGALTAPDLALTYASVAKEMGVKVFERVAVDKVVANKRVVSHVETSAGKIDCEYFVNCGGMWAHSLGKKSKPEVKVPLHPCEHFYITTKPIEGMDPMMPVVRDYDGLTYFREWSGGILAGGFEPVAKPAFLNGIPKDFQFGLLPDDWDHFQVLLDPILHRMPVMEEANVHKMFNGPESFTPDGHWNLGAASEIRNYYVAAGMSSMGIAGSGGIGKYLTEWITEGMPSIDLSSHDILRHVPHHNNPKFLAERVKETLGMYTLRYPNEQRYRGRKLRTSPLHTRLEVQGACFGETNAYERPMWFTNSNDDYLHDQYNIEKGGRTFAQPSFFDNVRDEYWACKENVCLIDMSSFTKTEVRSKGPEALQFLQYLSSNNIEQPIGTIIHTGMQNKFGGYENDCTIVPMENNTFFMISPTSQQTRSLNWLLKHRPADGSVEIRDVTSAYAGINVIGPHAPQLLNDVSGVKTSRQEFKQMTCKVIDVGFASNIIAMRLTHSGEDGFVLYVPSEYGLHVYETLVKAGKDYGIRDAGYYALRELRIEKFYAYWGSDLTTHTTPLESGREFRVAFEKGDFIGKDALLKQRENGISQRFAQFFLNDFDYETDVWPWGGEPIYRNGKYCGTITSTGYAHTLERMTCLGFVTDYDSEGKRVLHKAMHDFILDKSAKYEIAIAGKKFPAEVNLYTKQAVYQNGEPVFIPAPKR